jgi:hypothetical protein
MTPNDALKIGLDMAEFVSLGYLGDLTDADLMKRPTAGANHINWQVGHIIASENSIMNGAIPGSMPALPEGFAAKYTKETATSDDARRRDQRACRNAVWLGCTPSWLDAEQKYKCPCHGSGFYITGINFEGPAPRPLERVGLTLGPDGMLEVDKSLKFQEELGQWTDQKSYVKVG